MSEGRKLAPAEVVTVAAGGLAFLATFLPWVKIGRLSVNAWGDGLFPTYTWVGLFGAALAVLTLLAVFSTVRLPERLLGFTLGQVRMVLAAVALLLAISFLIAGEEHGVGFWFSLLAAIALVAAERVADRPVPSPTPTPPEV